MDNDEENRKLAEFIGFRLGGDGLCIEPTGYYNVPVPDFRRDPAMTLALLEKLFANGCHVTFWPQSDRLILMHCSDGLMDMISIRAPNPKEAVRLAALAYIEASKK